MSRRILTIQEQSAAFRRLLERHAALLSTPSASAEATAFKGLLEGFSAAYGRASAEEGQKAQQDVHLFRTFFPGYQEALEAWRSAQEATADDFNVLDVLQVSGDELRYSMILAWLLDRDMTRFGTHAQGNLGFRLFLSEVGLPEDYAAAAYRVRREVASSESRMDLEIAARGAFVIHIENKIWSGEGIEQTNREWRDLQKRALMLGIRSPDAMHALFLTPDGSGPRNANFRPVSWRQIGRALDKFADRARPHQVRLFAIHCARVLSRNITGEAADKEMDDAQDELQ